MVLRYPRTAATGGHGDARAGGRLHQPIGETEIVQRAAAFLPCEITSVPVVSGISVEEFDLRFRRPGLPVIIEGEAASWPAIKLWPDLDRLVERVGAATEVWLRQVADPEDDYTEDYRQATFGQFVTDLALDGNCDYLTQGLIFPPTGPARMAGRARYPALLEGLAEDCRLPELIDPAMLIEGLIWLGSGGQVTPVHFDETENLNVLVTGTKEWLLFPPDEGPNLALPGIDGRGSVLSSIESLASGGTWQGGSVRTAYHASPTPGQMLYVPTGYCHQVKSGDQPSIAVNFWYWDFKSPRHTIRSLRATGLRRMGYHKPLKRVVFEALVVLGAAGRAARYVVRDRRRPWPRPLVGGATYGV